VENPVSIAETLARLRGALQIVVDADGQILESRVVPPASRTEIEEAFPQLDGRHELVELWSTTREAELFTDPHIGGWGLRLLNPAESAAVTHDWLRRRPDDVRRDDIVVGEFLHDEEAVLLTAGGNLLILLPREPRDMWWRLNIGLAEFLARYVDAGGEKFWEGHGIEG
jgi:hypothetical protein